MFVALRLLCLSVVLAFVTPLLPASAAAHAVPHTLAEAQAAGRAAAPEVVQKYEAQPRTADPAYLPILDKLQALAAGSADPAGEAALKEFLKLAQKKGGVEGAELRTLYDGPFTGLMQKWQEWLEADGAGLEERARLAHLHRMALRELTRDLMRDTNAVAILHARDRVKYGHETGPTYEQLYAKEKAKPGATDDDAWAAIIGSSQRHNKEVSNTVKGTTEPVNR